MTDFNTTIQKIQARFNCDKGAAIVAIYGRKGGRLGQKCNFIKWQDQTTPADFQNYLQTMITE